MKRTIVLGVALAATALGGCAILEGGHSETHASSSLVGFLYPDDRQVPQHDSIPQLNLPLRVGLAFLPSRSGETADGLEASRREELLERIRTRFADRTFVSQIVVIPEYYLRSESGFSGLEGVQRLYNVDIMALVSYDQVTHRDDNSLSLAYLTIVGAYMFKGSRHDVTTLMDLAVVDPGSRALVLRAGGTDSRHGATTLVKQDRESRDSKRESYEAATGRLIDNFDAALLKFEADVKAGKANVRVSHRGHGGVGSMDLVLLAFFGMLLLVRLRKSGFAPIGKVGDA